LIFQVLRSKELNVELEANSSSQEQRIQNKANNNSGRSATGFALKDLEFPPPPADIPPPLETSRPCQTKSGTGSLYHDASSDSFSENALQQNQQNKSPVSESKTDLGQNLLITNKVQFSEKRNF